MKQNGKPKRLTVEGLYLWDVEIKFTQWIHMATRTLVITTRGDSLHQATKKAMRILHRDRYEFPKAKIESISRQGRIYA